MKNSESSPETYSFLADVPAGCSKNYSKFKGPVILNDRHAQYSSSMGSCPMFSAGEEKLLF